jgi:hypothetical protein
MLRKNLPVADDLLLEKAKEFGEILGISTLLYSKGWMANFKTRYNLSKFKIVGESASISADDIFTKNNSKSHFVGLDFRFTFHDQS